MKMVIPSKTLKEMLSKIVNTESISQFNFKSTILDLSVVDKTKLVLKTEYPGIVASCTYNLSESLEDKHVLIRALPFYKLISTFGDEGLITFNFDEKITITYNKSIYHIAIESTEESLSSIKENNATESFKINEAALNTISKYQVPIIKASYSKPIYNNVYLGDKVITTFYLNGIYSCSNKNPLNRTCLVSPQLINSLCMVPDADIYDNSDYFIAEQTFDDYTYLAEMHTAETPQYSAEDFKADVIVNTMSNIDEKSVYKVTVSNLSTLIAQMQILSDSTDTTINFEGNGKELSITSNYVNAENAGTCDDGEKFEISVFAEDFRPIISKLQSETISIAPVKQEDVIVGVYIEDGDVKYMVTGASED